MPLASLVLLMCTGNKTLQSLWCELEVMNKGPRALEITRRT